MRLFIAEKPSLGRAIAENIGNGSKMDGYISLNGGNDIVTWCFGHILEQYSPDDYDAAYEKWSMDVLPIVPAQWKLKVKKDAGNQLKIIKELVTKADYIVNAGDPDREGQLLIDEVLEYLKNKKPVKRILLNALDERSVKTALDDLRDNNDFAGLKNSARARSYADWLVGMNLTRAYTIKGREAGYGVIRIGRVKTPTLALTVRREEEIKKFQPTTYYLVNVIFKHDKGLIPTTWKMKEGIDGQDNDGRLLKKDIADNLLQKIQAVANHGNGAIITSVEQKKGMTGQRLPYSLSSLQVEAGKKYGYTPQQVLDTMQDLYEKKLTTYPRSDCEYLPTNQLGDAKSVIKIIAATFSNDNDMAKFAQEADTRIVSRAWNDAKISAHHAIIPTTQKATLSALTEIQKKLYAMVVRAYLAQFYPIHTFMSTKIVINCADESFQANGKTIIEMGWKELYSKDSRDDNENELPSLPQVSEHDAVIYNEGNVKEKVTTPPKRFTDATLLQAMKEIHKYVQDKKLATTLKDCKGIGTEATRATIIEDLKKSNLLRVEKKFLVPTDTAYMAIKILPDKLTYPDSTAVWEHELDEISEGKADLTTFIDAQVKNIREILSTIKNTTISTNKDAVTCPSCGKIMQRRKGKAGYFWGCSNYPNCKQTFPDKNGKPDMENKKRFTLTGKKEICPNCGKNLRQVILDGSKFWGCEDIKCKTSFPDHDDKPVIIRCANCGEGYMKRAESKKSPGKFYWYCTAKCGVKPVWDKDGLPNFPKID